MRIGRHFSVLLVLVATLRCGGETQLAQNPPAVASGGGSVAFAGPASSGAIHSMDPAGTNYDYIEVTSGVITSFTAPASLPASAIQLPAGAAVFPGFIDSHSHAVSFSIPGAVDARNQPFWINLASVNVMQQPTCLSGKSTPTCFVPVQTQDEVNALIKSAKPNAIGWVLGWNYEPSRLSCLVNGNPAYGFLCPHNFENASASTALQQLDALQPNVPVMVTSESGHIVYVNTLALKALNICPATGTPPSGCHTPTVNPQVEAQLAATGQLDEDLAMFAAGYVVGQISDNLKKQQPPVDLVAELIAASAKSYSQLGYTTMQEGAAELGLILAYTEQAKPGKLPVRVAALNYIDLPASDAARYAEALKSAADLQKVIKKKGLDMFIAGIKMFADGSNQGFTGAMAPPVQYQNLNPPFTNAAIFPKQPYDGLPDIAPSDLAKVMTAAHTSGFPVWVHSNGNQAQTNTLSAMTMSPSTAVRDVIVHFTTPTLQQVRSLKGSNIGVTFLLNDFYYYYQPLCQQIVGSGATANLYPAKWALESGVHFGLHSDTSVTPPDPLFSMWVATTRSVQSPFWIPPMLPDDDCQKAKSNQAITRMQAMRAYTSDAAWLYNRNTPSTDQPAIGSLQLKYAGDLVVLSADPLNPATDLSKVYVLYTVHNGNIVYRYAGQKPVWPANP